MQYYVYALIDPKTEKPFYIGKGKDMRLKHHFIEADSFIDNTDLEEISDEELRQLNRFNNVEKLLKIRTLYSDGYEFKDIARIIAKNLDEESAFTIEALLIKSIYGFENLTNKVIGKHSERFRPHKSWQIIEGFDLASSSDKNRNSRVDKLNAMIAERLDRPLREMIIAFPELSFDEPKVLDSGELGIEADVEGTRVKVGIRRSNLFCELRGRKKEQHHWIQNHFEMLEKANLLRADHVFLPNCWKREKMTNDIEEMVKRVQLMIEVIKTKSYEELSDDAKRILE